MPIRDSATPYCSVLHAPSLRIRPSTLPIAAAFSVCLLARATPRLSRAHAVQQSQTANQKTELSERTSSGLINLNFKDADVRDIFTGIGIIAGVNFILDGTVLGRMTINLKKVTLEEAIRSLCNIGNYNYVKLGTVYNISRSALSRPLLVEMREGQITIEATRSDLGDILQRIAQVSGKNIIPTQNVVAQVTFSVRNVPFETALETLVTSNGFTLERRPPAPGAPAEDMIYIVDRPLPKVGGSGESASPPTVAPPAVKPVSPGPPEPGQPRSETVTLTAENREIADLLRDLTNQTGVPITLGADIAGKRSLRLTEATVEQALASLLTGSKYWYVKQESGYLVGDVSGKESREIAPFLVTEKIPLKFLKAEEAPDFLSSLIPKESVRSLKSENAILVTSPTDVIARVKKEIEQIDTPASQVMLQAVLVEINKSYAKDLGVEISGEFDSIKGQGPMGAFLTFVSPESLDRKLTATLTGLITQGKGRVLANPRIATINGHKASIDIVQQRFFRTTPFSSATTSTSNQTGTDGRPNENVVLSPFVNSQIDSIDAGIKLEITPWVGSEGDITVEVTPEVSTITGTGPEGLPELSTRKATTTIRVKDGQNIVIGGLRQREVTKSTTRPWLLGDIPYLGRLFHHTVTNKRDTELVILIKPTLLLSKSDGKPTADEGDPALPEGLNPNPDTRNSETGGN